MLYMMERFNYLVQKQYEDAMYREEMHYKDIYYEEACLLYTSHISSSLCVR